MIKKIYIRVTLFFILLTLCFLLSEQNNDTFYINQYNIKPNVTFDNSKLNTYSNKNKTYQSYPIESNLDVLNNEVKQVIVNKSENNSNYSYISDNYSKNKNTINKSSNSDIIPFNYTTTKKNTNDDKNTNESLVSNINTTLPRMLSNGNNDGGNTGGGILDNNGNNGNGNGWGTDGNEGHGNGNGGDCTPVPLTFDLNSFIFLMILSFLYLKFTKKITI